MEIETIKRFISEEYKKGNKKPYLKIKSFCNQIYLLENKEKRKGYNAKYYNKILSYGKGEKKKNNKILSYEMNKKDKNNKIISYKNIEDNKIISYNTTKKGELDVF